MEDQTQAQGRERQGWRLHLPHTSSGERLAVSVHPMCCFGEDLIQAQLMPVLVPNLHIPSPFPSGHPCIAVGFVGWAPVSSLHAVEFVSGLYIYHLFSLDLGGRRLWLFNFTF